VPEPLLPNGFERLQVNACRTGLPATSDAPRGLKDEASRCGQAANEKLLLS
jgi:hypothetical protein